ncbi:LLM class flavin-dependent oxidoreductase [Vibrio cortegadensis]|uniref:LLM class flavin-dependent oxidoreductase n=1 Tax=Vibrio cortegadensis TaxID=1328770 RepID=UPI00352F94F1
MKFSLFLHMERYDDNKTHKESLAELTELVQIAEQGGFEMAWVGEHHGMEFTIAPNPINYITYLANKTTTIRLGAGTFIAPFWHPVKLAGEAALADIMCDGRLEFGIARGAYQAEFDRLMNGMPAADGGKYLREMVPVLQKLWTGDCAHDGELFQFPTTTSVPKPLQQPHPPMWVAARDPDSHNFAISNGCNVMVTPLQKNDEEVQDLMNKFNEACTNNPQVDRPDIMLLRHTFVGENEQDLAAGTNALHRWYSMFMAWARNNQTPTDGFVKHLSSEDLGESFSKDTLRNNLAIGTPEEMVTRLKYYETLGISQYSYWADNNLSFEEKKKSLQLFIDKVMPKFN